MRHFEFVFVELLKLNCKRLFFAFIILMVFPSCEPPEPKKKNQTIITDDIANFWQAYDQIITTTDSTEQLLYLQEYFLAPGTPGLHGIMRARNYTPQEYLAAINDFPKFWESVRPNTLKAYSIADQLESGVKQLKQIYPELKPAKIYLTIGALRTNGTTIDGMLLIGTELAMGDEHTITHELTNRLGHLPAFFKNNPIDNVLALNIHEYIHTQQNAIGGYDLLSQCVFEGIAEFIPVVALNEPSNTPAIAFGKAHVQAVKAAFTKEMFSPWAYNWIWNDFDNAFKMRDLGYYIGYAIAEKHYEQAPDKKKAIKELIELDFSSPHAVEAFVEATGYFDQPLAELKSAYETNRPKVVGTQPFKSGSTKVFPSLSQISIEFSESMDSRFTSTDFGNLGRAHFPAIDHIDFSPDGKTATYHLDGRLKPNHQYQMQIKRGFRTPDMATPLQPYLIEFKTTGE